MAIFTKIMGLLWLLAEGLIMVYMRKVFLFLAKGDTDQKNYLIIWITFFIILTLFNFSLELNLNNFFKFFNFLSHHRYYNGYVWNFLCTLLLVIEGAIVIYSFKIFRLLKGAIEGRQYTQATSLRYESFILFVIFLVLYLIYHLYLNSLIGATGLRDSNIKNIFFFYIKLCGIFWILFEWAVALIGIKVFFLLKRMQS